MINKLDAVCLLVENVKITLDFYQNKLGLIVKSTDTGPKTTSWGQVVAYLHDPDHNIIELTSYEGAK